MLFPPPGHAGSLIAPSSLPNDKIEEIEKLTLRWLFHALQDFGKEAFNIFELSPDEVQDIAEDITREVLDRLPGYNLQERVYGNVDYKRARYIILPDFAVRQALFVDSKAEKSNSSATIQMSQTSMEVRQVRAGQHVNAQGFLNPILSHDGKEYLTTTAIIHYKYADVGATHKLREATIACIPNGKLQNAYNPTVHDGIWNVGRNAPTLNEDFRVRLSFHKLKSKKRWRVQQLSYDPNSGICVGQWEE